MIKKIIDNKEYWVDGNNNNKWSCDKYTEEQAHKFSRTLVDRYLRYTASLWYAVMLWCLVILRYTMMLRGDG